MMNTVDDEVKLLSQAALRFVMKNIPVDDVLKKSPDQHTDEEQARHRQDRQSTLPKRGI